MNKLFRILSVASSWTCIRLFGGACPRRRDPAADSVAPTVSMESSFQVLNLSKTVGQQAKIPITITTRTGR